LKLGLGIKQFFTQKKEKNKVKTKQQARKKEQINNA